MKRIETERLILRKFKLGDEKYIFNNWANDDRVTKDLSWPTHADISITKKVLDYWLSDYDNDTYLWAIVLKESDEPIGSFAVVNHNRDLKRAEIGYCIGYDYWGKGYTAEAFKGVIPYLFEEGFIRIEALHHVSNPNSGKVMIKSGLTYEGCLKKYLKNNKGQLVDCEIYSIVREE